MARVRHRHATVVLLGAMLTVLLLACARTAAGQQQEQQRWRRRVRPAATVPSPAEVLAAKANGTAAATAADAAHAAGDPRIVGGYAAGSTEFRFMAALVQRVSSSLYRDDFNQQFCGAALIGSPTSVWAITAAHCVNGATPSSFDVLVGSSRLDNSGTRHQVKNIYMHTRYDSSWYDYDIALIRLKTPPASTIPRVELGYVPSVGQQLTVIGWGTIQETPSRNTWPMDLQRVEVNVVDKSRYGSQSCNRPSAYNLAVRGTMFCAGPMQGGKDSCQGDSGGPILRAKPGGGWRSVGLVSWGEGCARANHPGVYTALSSVASFINTKSGITLVA